jgi:hypothetical protein
MKLVKNPDITSCAIKRKLGEELDEDEAAKAFELFSKLSPPRAIRIYLVMDKANIVPGKIEFRR